jgi:hypothetical protein
MSGAATGGNGVIKRNNGKADVVVRVGRPAKPKTGCCCYPTLDIDRDAHSKDM